MKKAHSAMMYALIASKPEPNAIIVRYFEFLLSTKFLVSNMKARSISSILCMLIILLSVDLKPKNHFFLRIKTIKKISPIMAATSGIPMEPASPPIPLNPLLRTELDHPSEWPRL